MKTVVLRPDCRPASGLGHFYRTLRLAVALQQEDFNILFVVPPGLSPQLVAEMKRYRLVFKEFNSPLNPSAITLPRKVLADAEAFGRFLKKLGVSIDWLVTDDYHLDQVWEKKIRGVATQIATFDDDDGRRHACDLLINSSFSLSNVSRLRARNFRKTARFLLGPRFFVPDPLMVKALFRRPMRKSIKEIFFFLGGSVTASTFESALKETLGAVERYAIRVTAVPPLTYHPRSNPRFGGRLRIETNYSRISAILRSTDLFVGSGGTVTHDRLLFAVPGIVMHTAENQIPICKALADQGAHLYLGSVAKREVGLLKDAVSLVVRCPELFHSLRKKSVGLVDHLGGRRLAANFKHFPIALRPAVLQDEGLILRWRNSSGARSGSLSSERIGREAHHKWFMKNVKSRSSNLLIAESPWGPVAVLRYDLANSSSAEVSINLNPRLYGLGLGAEILNQGSAWIAQEYPKLKELTASIKPENISSRNSFLKAGFIASLHHYSCTLR